VKKNDFSIGSVIADVNKKFGKDKAGLASEQKILPACMGGVSTQCVALDIAIGRTGIPLGRLTEISGLESHGKSTLGAHILAEAQRRGGLAILVDTEKAYEQERARVFGIDTDSLVVLNPEHMEEALQMINDVVKAIPEGVGPTVVVWDSVAGTPAMAEVEGKFDDRTVGIHARILALGMRKLVPVIAEKQVAFVCINQLRDNIGKYGHAPDYKTFGGHAMRFHATLQIRVKRIGVEKKGTKPIAIQCRAKLEKNKVGAPLREADFLIDFEKGLDKSRDLMDQAIEFGLLKEGHGTILHDGVSYRASDFSTIVLPLLGGAGRLRKRILQQAYKAKLIKPYAKKAG